MNETQPERTRIHTVITRSAILHVEDALEIGKLRLRLYRYRRGEGAEASAYHYLDVADARVLFSDLAWGRLRERFVDYKGSPTARDGGPLSRVLRVEDVGDQARNPIVFEIQNGPGEVIGEGAIKPAGEPDSKVAILMGRREARKLAFAVLEYLQAWAVARAISRPPAASAQPPQPEQLVLEFAPAGAESGGNGQEPEAESPPAPVTPTDFWSAVYARWPDYDEGQREGQRLLDRAGGDFGQALRLLRGS